MLHCTNDLKFGSDKFLKTHVVTRELEILVSDVQTKSLMKFGSPTSKIDPRPVLDGLRVLQFDAARSETKKWLTMENKMRLVRA